MPEWSWLTNWYRNTTISYKLNRPIHFTLSKVQTPLAKRQAYDSFIAWLQKRKCFFFLFLLLYLSSRLANFTQKLFQFNQMISFIRWHWNVTRNDIEQNTTPAPGQQVYNVIRSFSNCYLDSKIDGEKSAVKYYFHICFFFFVHVSCYWTGQILKPEWLSTRTKWHCNEKVEQIASQRKAQKNVCHFCQ